MKIDVLDVKFNDITLESAVSHACELIRGDGKAYITTPNPEIVWRCRKNEVLHTAINGSALVLPDGIGIIMAARILGTPLRGGRVAGSDFISVFFQKIAETGESVFLFGAKPGVADKAGRNLTEKYPGLIIAGVHDGYFDEAEPVIEMINKVSPSLLLVCLGSPKQEIWMSENIDKLDVRLCAGLGGMLDVFAGNVKRAPRIFIRFGLEWLYRIIREPRRLKRAACLPLFVFAVIWRRIRKQRRTKETNTKKET